MRKDCKLTKEECETFGLDYETDPEVQKEFDVLEELKSKYDLQDIYNNLTNEDIENELARLKSTGLKNKEDKDMFFKLLEAQAESDFIEKNTVDWTKVVKDNPDTLYF